MPYKPGGGNKPQLYDRNDGEYVKNPQEIEDTDHLIMTKVFGFASKKPIVYPIHGTHSIEYARLVVKYCLNYCNPKLSEDKITKYLLVYNKGRDKSNLLNELGYNQSNWVELYNQILLGANFKKRKLSRYLGQSLTINVETKIWNKTKKKYYFCTTSWQIEKDFSLRFVTLIQEVFKDGE